MRSSLPPRLRLEWAVVVLVLAGAIAVGHAALLRVVPPPEADRWLLVAGGVAAYEVGFLRYHLGANRPGGGPVRPRVGAANHVTLARGGLYAGTAGCLLVTPAVPAVAWLPGILYGAGAALDLADGAIARHRGMRTPLGEKLDHAFDTLGFLAAPLVGVAWGRLPVFYLSVSLARYAYRGALAWRRRRGRPVGDLPASRIRRPLAALQMAFIAGGLVPVVPAATVHVLAAVAAAPTLAVFARDYLAVTGRIAR